MSVCVCVGGGGDGVNIFQGGWVQLVPWEGLQFLISIEIYRTNDFQRGGGPDPLSHHLWTRACTHWFWTTIS